MCAIVGISSRYALADRTWLTAGRDAMTQRGPDDAGEWWSDDGRVGLAHRRLAIVDLSSAGHQPMRDPTGSLTLVFNGEIYNFAELRQELEGKGVVFRSRSDTEVILAAYREWGTDCLARLNGMFAFALYDATQRSVFLARDRAGEKPLFYHHAQDTLRFASELKGLFADASLPRRIAREALDCYLAMGYVPGERCILQDFQKLPPAHALWFDLTTGAIRTWRYWQLPELAPSAGTGDAAEASLLDELESLLERAVRRQMVADVPVGVLLSGGVDSSLITAMAVRASSKVKTFTIRFPGHGMLDETEHARLIAHHFGTDHTELEAASATPDLLPHLARQFDEPMADSSMIPTCLVSRLIRQQCAVALGGDGGDEMFGGYHSHSRMVLLKEYFGRIPLTMRKPLSKFAAKVLPLGARGRSYLVSLGFDYCNDLPHFSELFDVATRRNLLYTHPMIAPNAETIRADRIPNDADVLQRITRMDFQNYLAEDILVKVDRASMLNSLEIRAPFLDCGLIEFAFGKVPSRLKATARDKKILLKRLTARILPPEFDRQRKQGFAIPLADWLRGGPFRELFHDVLLDSQSIFAQRTVRKLLQGQDRGRNNGERLFALVLFELWRREYAVAL